MKSALNWQGQKASEEGYRQMLNPDDPILLHKNRLVIRAEFF
jgi:hypothetical protein